LGETQLARLSWTRLSWPRLSWAETQLAKTQLARLSWQDSVGPLRQLNGLAGSCGLDMSQFTRKAKAAGRVLLCLSEGVLTIHLVGKAVRRV
jgi:hypothetical protein